MHRESFISFEQANHPATANEPKRPQPEAQRLKLLLVDDQPSIRDSLSRLLRRQGFLVTLAENGRQAIERAASERFDVVLLDLSMPDVDGWDALKRIVEIKPGLAVVVMTAHSHQRNWVEPLGAGALLEKPLDIPLLLATIREVARQSVSVHNSVDLVRQFRFKHYPPRRASALANLQSESGINE